MKDSVNQFLMQRIQPSKSQLKEAIMSRINGGQKSSSVLSVTEYFKEFIRIKSKTGVTQDTLKVYQNVLNHFESFRQKRLKGRSIEFKDMDKELWLEFRAHLEVRLEANTVHKIIKKLKTVMHDAERNGYNVPKCFLDRDIQVRYVKQPKIYLNETEIRLLTNLTLPAGSHLDRVRDRFIIGLRTGLRFSDLIRINISYLKEHEGKKFFQIKLNKGQNFVVIPVHETVRLILEKYEGYPPTMSMQKFNQSLKLLCEKAGIDSNVSKVIKGKQEVFKKYSLVSSHICRRSFATNAYKAGVNPLFLQRIVGHSSMKQLMEYICIDEEDTLSMMLKNSYFNP